MKKQSSHKPGSQFLSCISCASAKWLWMPRMHAHTLTSAQIPALVLLPQKSTFPAADPLLQAAFDPQRCCPCAESLRGPFSPYTLGKAITFTPIAGEKLELINLAAGKRQHDILSNYCPCRISCHFQPGALSLLISTQRACSGHSRVQCRHC